MTREEVVRKLFRERPRSRFARASLWLLTGLGVSSWWLGDFSLAETFSERRMENFRRFLGEVVPRPLRGRDFDGGVLAEWAGAIFAEKAGPAAATTLAISSGFAMRPSGIAASSLLRRAGLSMVLVLIGVSTAPGPTPTTRILCGASSTPAVRVSIRMPPLDRQ